MAPGANSGRQGNRSKHYEDPDADFQPSPSPSRSSRYQPVNTQYQSSRARSQASGYTDASNQLYSGQHLPPQANSTQPYPPQPGNSRPQRYPSRAVTSHSHVPQSEDHSSPLRHSQTYDHESYANQPEGYSPQHTSNQRNAIQPDAPHINNQPTRLPLSQDLHRRLQAAGEVRSKSNSSAGNRSGPSNPGSSKSGNTSAAKTKQSGPKDKDKETPEKTPVTKIKLGDLRWCSPQVVKRSKDEAIQDYGALPNETRKLYDSLLKIPLAVIPASLMSLYHDDATTPRKSRDPIPHYHYMPSQDVPYPSNDLDRLKRTVDYVVKTSRRYQRVNAHERCWGALGHHIFAEFAYLPVGKEMVIFNAEQCAIGPPNLRTMLPNGLKFNYPTEPQDTAASDNADNQTVDEQGVKKMVDWIVGLNLSPDVEEAADAAFRLCRRDERSFNQSQSFINETPIFLDIEVKKDQPARDPELNLAVWASAAFKKKQFHGWSTEMPMPAIVIEGRRWDYYLFFVKGHRLIMMGPMSMGNTSDYLGVWQLIYRLYLLINWGMTDFREKFEADILAWKQRIVVREVSSGMRNMGIQERGKEAEEEEGRCHRGQA
ncbi:MAG: hypothetical protein Q9220_007619 [cf. Caloplaca sp. 1 TL-2023]